MLPAIAAAAAGLGAPVAIAIVANRNGWTASAAGGSPHGSQQAGPATRTNLDVLREAGIPSTSVPVVTWQATDDLADFPRVARAAWEKYGKPVLFRGVPLTAWGGPALWAPPSEHLEAIIASESETARPKVSHTSFFQYFFTPKQDEWRERWKLEPPPTTFHWDHDAPPPVLRKLLGGTRNASQARYGCTLLLTHQVFLPPCSFTRRIRVCNACMICLCLPLW